MIETTIIHNSALKAREAKKLVASSADEPIAMPTYKVLPISSLGVASYQREPKKSSYMKIAKNLDMDILGVPLVSHRKDGDYEYWLIDGQTRCRALQHKKVENVLCQVIDGLTFEEEAEKYLKLNTERIALNANQKFVGKLGKKDEIAVHIVSILERYGFAYATNTGLKDKNKIACLSSLYSIYEDIKATGFENVIYLLRRVWDGSSASVHAQIIRGLSGFIKYHSDFFDLDVLVAALRSCSPEIILDEAAEMDTSRNKRHSWGDKNTFICVSKVIWKKYIKFCSENGIQSIPWMFS